MRPIIASLALALLVVVSACSGGDKESFRNVDHDKNGKISYEELLFVFPDVTPEVFNSVDGNGDGSLSEEEYKAFLKKYAAGIGNAGKQAQPAASPARPQTLPQGNQNRPAGAANPPAVPYHGEEVIEIPAPGSGQSTKTRPDTKGKKDVKEQKDPKNASENLKKGEATQYTVGRGDILSHIARKFGVTVEDIVRANGNMNPDTLRDGQVLNIPARP